MVLQLKHIALQNFKNYSQLSLALHERFNLVSGLNGSGKTNLLDAVYYLTFCKSNFNSSDKFNIKYDCDFFRLQGQFLRKDEQEEILCKVQRSKAKQIFRNEVKYAKFSEHIGLLPVVFICPDDIDLVKGQSEKRRKLLDTCLSQVSHHYLAALIKYRKARQQRNALFKQYGFNPIDPHLIAAYDQQLISYAEVIHRERSELLRELAVPFNKIYAALAGKEEGILMEYNSALNDASMEEILQRNLQKDRILQRTSSGVHTDDISFIKDDHELRKIGSQGQQKSCLLALKLAMISYLKEKKGMEPILLLDDIFDKLDKERMAGLIAWIASNLNGQVFISDTHPGRLEEIVGNAKMDYKSFLVNQGKVEVHA